MIAALFAKLFWIIVCLLIVGFIWALGAAASEGIPPKIYRDDEFPDEEEENQNHKNHP